MAILPLLDFQELLVFTVLLALVNSIAYLKLADQKAVKALKEEVASYKTKMNAARKAGNNDEMLKFMKAMNEKSMQQFNHMYKPLIASMVIFIIPLVAFFPHAFAATSIKLPFALPEISGAFPFNIHFRMTTEYNWFWWYLIVLFPSSFAFRKALGVQ